MTDNVDRSLLRRRIERGKVARGGGGGDDGGDMLDNRVAALEAEMREVKGTLARIETALRELQSDVKSGFKAFDDRLRKVEIDLARVDGRLQAMPSTWTMVMAILATVLTVMGGAFTLLRFAN